MAEINDSKKPSDDDEKPSASADISIELGRTRCGARIGVVVPPEESKRLLQLLSYSGTGVSALTTLVIPILIGLPVGLAIGAAVFVATLGVVVTMQR